ncbi:MAG: FAD-dependent oxidoreductase [Oscillospiraceae bacterium]|nr:FAD-dependent oxidoreductase [Oscillospiraceae bacterium]
MPSISKLNKQLDKLFDGQVEAYEENDCLVLSGELSRWSDIVTAGMLAVAENPYETVVNEILCTGEKPLPIRKPRMEDSHLEWEEPDVLIIGGGVIGCAIARELSRYKLDILLIEKENDLAMQASGRCNGLVHSGVGLKKTPLKQWYTKTGNQMYAKLCSELGVPFRRCGEYLCYTNRLWSPLMFLSQMYWRWQGMKNAKVVKGDALHTAEPGLGSDISAALFFPDAGVVCPHTLTIALAENAVQNGAFITFNTMVQGMTVEDGLITGVLTNRGTIKPKVVVNASGAFCEDIAAMAGDRFFSVHPVKGTNVVIDRKYAGDLARAAVSSYGKPPGRRKKRSKTVFGTVLRTMYGTVVAGTDNLETINKEDFSTHSYSVSKVITGCKRIVPELDEKQAITYYSGINAPTYEGDYIVSKGKMTTNIVHAAGISTPGLTAAPAIAVDIVDMVADLFGGKNSLKSNTEFDPVRKAPIRLADLDFDTRAELIASNPDYGIIVCRCENISKAEVIEVLGRNVRCDSLDGIKRRIRPGRGRCQGSFCSPIIHDLIASEKRLTPQHIRKSGSGSEITYGSSKAIAHKKSSAIHFSKESGTDKDIKEKARKVLLAQSDKSKRSDEDDD